MKKKLSLSKKLIIPLNNDSKSTVGRVLPSYYTQCADGTCPVYCKEVSIDVFGENQIRRTPGL